MAHRSALTVPGKEKTKGSGERPTRPQSSGCRSRRAVVLLPALAFAVLTGLRREIAAEEDADLFEFSTHHEDGDSIRRITGD